MSTDKFFQWVSELPPPAITCLGILLIGFALKRTAIFPNDLIPIFLIVVVGPGLYTLSRYGLARFAVEGMVYGGLVWLMHKQVWKRFIAPKLGLGKDVEPFDDTENKSTETKP